MNNHTTIKKYCKQVNQLDNKRNILNTFPSIKSASDYINNTYDKKCVNISIACRESHRTAGGFYWEYV